jgi:hypothetical protein
MEKKVGSQKKEEMQKLHSKIMNKVMKNLNLKDSANSNKKKDSTVLLPNIRPLPTWEKWGWQWTRAECIWSLWKCKR